MKSHLQNFPIEYREKTSFSAVTLAILAALTLPMEEYYVFGTHITLNYIAMLLLLMIVRKKAIRKIGLRRDFILIGIIYIFMGLLAAALYLNEAWYSDSAFKNLIFIVPATFILLYYYIDTFSIRFFLHCVTFLAIVSSIIIIYQRLSFLLHGDYFANFAINFIPGVEFGREDALQALIRPSAFFSEPAHYAEFCLPVFVYHSQKKHVWTSMLIVFGFLMSGSTTGLVCMLVVLLCGLYFNAKSSNKKQRGIILTIIFATFFCSVYYVMDYYYPEIMTVQFGKLERTDVHDSPRLLGALPILHNFNIIEWIIGIGIGNKDTFVILNHIPVAGGVEDNFTNTFFSLLVFFGIIGLVVFFIFMCHLYSKCCKGSNITYLLLMVSLFFSTNFIFSGNLLYYLFFVANTRYIEKCNLKFYK